MFSLVCLLALQLSLERAILEAEDGRVDDATVLVEALENPDPRIQRLAVRAIGRLERPRYAASVIALLDHRDPALRREAVNALGQMGADVDLQGIVEKEKDGAVRGVVYETMGRLLRTDERLLAAGLKDHDVLARTGAAKGLSLFFGGRNRHLRRRPSRL